MSRLGIVWIAEEEAFPSPHGEELLATFRGYWETDMAQGFAGLGLDEALAWGRARSDRVRVRLGRSDYFSAGQTIDAGFPAWPPRDLPEPLTRRPAPDGSPAPTPTDGEEITWHVELELIPPELLPADPAGRDALVAHVADESLATRSEALPGTPLPAAAAGEGWAVAAKVAYRLHFLESAPHRETAIASARSRCSFPHGWSMTGTATRS